MNLLTGQPEVDGSPVAGLFGPPLGEAFGVGMFLVGRRLGAADAEMMRTFLAQVLEASELSR